MFLDDNRSTVVIAVLSAVLLLTGCPPEDEDTGARDGGSVFDGGTRMPDGGSSMSDAGIGSGAREYGRGEYAIIFTGDTPPGRYCWFQGETVRVCPSPATRQTSYTNLCLADELNCLSEMPDDEESERRCWVRETWETVSNAPLYGDCSAHEAYWNDADDSVECLYHGHCDGGELCVDHLCECPEGMSCTPTEPEPGPGGDEPREDPPEGDEPPSDPAPGGGEPPGEPAPGGGEPPGEPAPGGDDSEPAPSPGGGV